MNKMIIGVVAAACALSGLAEEADKLPEKFEGVLSGGIVIKPYSGKRIHVVNLQKKLKDAALDKVVERIRLETVLPVYAVTNNTATNACAAIAQEHGRNAAFVLAVTNEKGKPTILCAPEDGWCVLNVAKLSDDYPSAKRFEERATKEVWRAFMYAMGVGHSMYQPCLMKPIAGVDDLDRTPMLQPGPEPFNKAQDAAAKLGVGKLRVASYRTACQEGWAPAPADDEQKRVWDEVHAIPKNPMKIEFDPKKGR